MAENSYICALRCGYGVIGTSNKGKALILSCGCSLVKYLVYGICNAIILGKLFAEIYSPVIKQSVTMGMKQSRSYDLLFIIDILCAGNNFLHFTGVNINGVISDCFYLFIGGVVVNSYKSHLLLAVNRLAVGADFYADRRFKGHSAKLLIICGINGAIGIHTLGNGHFVNMIFAVNAFIGDFFRRKSGFAVLIAVECNIYGGGRDFHGDGVFIFAHSRKNIAAVSAFAILALGAGFISGADNLAALFAGNGHGVVAVALCGVCGFGFGADVVARRGGNGGFDFYIFGADNRLVFHKTSFYSCNELCYLLFGNIALCSESDFSVLACRNSAEAAHFKMSDLHIGAFGIALRSSGNKAICIVKSVALIIEKVVVIVKSCFKRSNIY